jgi:hypothetical protein
METDGEQAWLVAGMAAADVVGAAVAGVAVAGSAAVMAVAAARAAVAVAITVLRRMGATVGRVGDGRETRS